MDPQAIKVELRRLTRETDAGRMTMREAAAEIISWLKKNHMPPKARKRPPLSITLSELRAIAQIKQSKIELPLRDLLAKKKGVRGNPPTPSRTAGPFSPRRPKPSPGA
jgi:hypothetical protein